MIGWAHSPRTAPLVGAACPCDDPEPRPGAELLRASFCRRCGCPVQLVDPGPSLPWCEPCHASLWDAELHARACHGG